MGSGSSKNIKADGAPSEPVTEQISIPNVEEGYPPPKPVTVKKTAIFNPKSFADIDKHARQAPDDVAGSYDELVEYLTGNFKSGLQKVRAIFIWIGAQPLDDKKMKGAKDQNTPRGHLGLVMRNKASYATFFVHLCRKAGVPAVLIDGVSKSAGYEVGAQDVKDLRNKWCAVYVNDSWRFVHPLWAFQVLVGHTSGNWTLVESGGKGAREKEQASAGVSVRQTNEYYFLPDADEFITMCFPDDPRWQLLRQPYTIEKYKNIPHFKQKYFETGTKIRGEVQCIISAKDGTCRIGFKSPDSFQMTYELFYNHILSNQKIPASIQLDKYVFMEHNKNEWAFKFRFPVKGVYKLSIYGSPSSNENFWGLCDFRADADVAQTDCKPLPDNPFIGWGAGADAENMGMTDPSQQSGILSTRPYQELHLSFATSKALVFKTQLKHNNIPPESLAGCVKQTVKKDHVDFSVAVPQEGEYALKVFAKEKGANGEFQNVCNYLVTTEEGKRKKRNFEDASEKRARQEMNAASKQGDTAKLKETMDKFVKKGMNDQGDYSEASNKYDYLTLKQQLTSAIQRRNVSVLDKAINDADQSRFAGKLQPQIQEAKELRDHLLKLDRFSHEILEMKQTTISEIHSYKNAMPLVYDVMAATYLLLGVEQRKIEHWDQVQALMRKTGKESLMRKVRQFDTIHLTNDTVDNVKGILGRYDENTVRKASAGVGTFYVWAKNVTDSYDANVPHDNQASTTVYGQGSQKGPGAKEKQTNDNQDTKQRQGKKTKGS